MCFREAKPYKMFTTEDGARHEFYFHRGTTRSLIMLLVSMKEKKVIQFAFKCPLHVIIQMYSHNRYYIVHYAYIYSSIIQSAIVYALVSYTIHAFTIV